jgi:hypothetical protein
MYLEVRWNRLRISSVRKKCQHYRRKLRKFGPVVRRPAPLVARTSQRYRESRPAPRMRSRSP